MTISVLIIIQYYLTRIRRKLQIFMPVIFKNLKTPGIFFFNSVNKV